MEATSARMAARDRFGEPGPSQLQRYIQSACDPSNFEPNLALDLEIADLINSKKGNAPREAAVAIVNYINQRNQNVSILALALLDICVKNCGYPFHLQISTKEFLNELVRRFPERPPIRPTRVQLKILEAIEEWRQTICQTSRHKEDLGFIRDMHRLLSYKGYMFPEIRREDAAVLNPSDNLKSAEEMEEEERAAQSAKLQELIRRGGPEDLQEANRLMKVMAGYDTKNKTDYRAKAAEEVGKIQQKARILEEMLETFQKGDKVTEGDVFEELANALQSAQPKIQKMCEEESDDSEAVAKLLEINDSIHRTIERYKLVKKGDLDGASRIPKGTLGSTTGVTKGDDNELSLIDLGSDEPSGAGKLSAANGGPKTESLEEDLLGLSFQDSTYGQGGGIALGFGANTNLPGPPLLSSTSQHSSAKPPTPSISPTPQAQEARPDYSAFPSLPSSRPPSSTGTAAASQFQQQSAQTQSTIATFPPFTSPAQHQASPFQFSQRHPRSSATPSSLLDLTQQPQPQTATNADAEEWTFSSSLPVAENTPPSSNEIIVTNSSVHILLEVTRPPMSEATILILARFSNNTSQPISDLTFQVAVTKGISLRLEPQSGRFLAPNQKDGITQVIHVNGVERGKGSTVKMRWKLSYNVAQSELREEQGEITALGVA
ncbi:hypothetical protein GP486_003440 [Trichoglossum hirsutum]|uniref:VHS domain-containing protein n=1 Tax=Trichoglossum hirsutum TaxID=265104 RepID=A0A9P8RQN8_9PEZI|nr:hypothetical protein GP486_003440 [Trichoglossum hirsutum]